MSSLFAELKRRNVVRVGIAYVILGWVIIQVADTVFPQFGFPEWTNQFVTIALALGLPIVLLLAWAFEMTPQGVMKTEEVDADASIHEDSRLRFSYAYRDRNYDNITPSIGVIRSETRSTFAVRYRVPVYKQVRLEGEYKYRDRNSNFPSSNYTENVISFNLSYEF